MARKGYKRKEDVNWAKSEELAKDKDKARRVLRKVKEFESKHEYEIIPIFRGVKMRLIR